MNYKIVKKKFKTQYNFSNLKVSDLTFFINI